MVIRDVLFTIKYPKLWLFLFLVLSSIIIFSLPDGKLLAGSFDGTNYLLDFVLGLFLPIGVLTPFLAGFFTNASPANIFLTAPAIGFGAMITDLIFISIIKRMFRKEFSAVKKKQLVKLKGFFVENWFGVKLVNYFSFALSGLIVAAPLPEETGKNLVAIISKLSLIELAIISLLANTWMALFFLFL